MAMQQTLKKLAAALLIAAFGGPAGAEEWIALSGAEIAEALTDRRAEYDGATQRFYASGRTLYNAGQDSWGYWAVRDDRYCSQWPPGEQWDCYSIERRDDSTIRFVGEFGDVTEGTLVGD